jgi:hypothetical protein
MIEDLMSLKKQIETMIETYKDLHPDEEDENYLLGRGVWNSEQIEKEKALKKVREGKYESAVRKKQRQETAKPSQGSPSLCVYGDS